MAQVTLSEIRELRDDLSFDTSTIREILEYVRDGDTDFTVDDYRFIHEDHIDEIMQDELASDEYVLGAATPWFIADILHIDQEAVEDIQKADAFAALGKIIISSGKLEEYQQRMAQIDGYGHHFSSYDGSEEQWGNYYVFRN